MQQRYAIAIAWFTLFRRQTFCSVQKETYSIAIFLNLFGSTASRRLCHELNVCLLSSQHDCNEVQPKFHRTLAVRLFTHDE